jgi:hypothetical protein
MTRSLTTFGRGALVGAVLALSGCGGLDGHSGLAEPLVVHDAQFFSGELPGEPPVVVGSGDEVVPPTATSGTPSRAELRQGLAGVTFTGQASGDAVAVASRFDDVGTGYWLLPTLFEDAQTPGTLVWTFTADLQHSLPAGIHRLLTVALDEDGNAGTQSELFVCINSLVPDNGNACDPAAAPPALVVSLEWDAPVDLDLAVVLPDGTAISWEHPTSGEADASGNIDLSVPGVGALQRDAGGDCLVDGRQREDIVFQALPPDGDYLVYANLNRACGEDHVSYSATYHYRTSDDGEYTQESSILGAGTLLHRQAKTGRGTFIGEVTVN